MSWKEGLPWEQRAVQAQTLGAGPAAPPGKCRQSRRPVWGQRLTTWTAQSALDFGNRL